MVMTVKELKKQEEEFFKIRDRIMDEAKKRGITLRTLGAIAFRTHSPKYKYLEYDLGRILTDIDFASYDKEAKKVRELFNDLGYEEDRAIRGMMTGMGMGKVSKRFIFHDNEHNIHFDVFFDELSFCHAINFKNRLKIDYPTIPLADLLLEKLQIVEINEKDVIDCIVLIREHDIADSDEEAINKKYIANLFSGDWGWWRTGTMNLDKIKHFAEKYDKMTEEDKKDIVSKVDELRKAIDEKSKSFKWKMRAKVGDKKIWYEQVEEVVR